MLKKIFLRLVVVLFLAIALAPVGLIASNVMSKIPSYVGVKDGRLSPAFAAKPNNITTYEAGAYPKEEPLQYNDDQFAAKQRLIALVTKMPRTKLITNDGDYVHITFTSRLFRFVDDVEFLFDDESKQIHFRSASRTGYSDMNVNQKRMAEIRTLFEQ